MSFSASGVVGKVNPRNTKVGITYSFTLDGDTKWYGTYKDTPPQEGQFVEFEYKTNGAGFHNVEMPTLKMTSPSESTTTAPAPAAATKAWAASSHKDANIQWQSARNAAVQLAVGALAGGAISLGSGKAEAKLEALMIQVNRLTLDFFDQSMEVGNTGEAPEDFRG